VASTRPAHSTASPNNFREFLGIGVNGKINNLQTAFFGKHLEKRFSPATGLYTNHALAPPGTFEGTSVRIDGTWQSVL
jgi:hypothetical protein